MALGDAEVAPADVATLEMHGTGAPPPLQPPFCVPCRCHSCCVGSTAALDVPCTFRPAGTALGDPIEVGAALTVWAAPPASRQLSAHPLELAAAKSVLGHAEPAAGAAGMLRALQRLASASPSGTLHLSAVNPYIAASLEGAGGSVPQCSGTAAALPAWMPRSPSSAASPGSGGGGRAGVSGFAFQGTNAHVVLACAG